MRLDVFLAGENHYHQSVLFEMCRPVSESHVEGALMEVDKKHPILCARFALTGGSWTQSICRDAR